MLIQAAEQVAETGAANLVAGLLTFVLLLTVLLSVPISFGLIWLYRRAVMKSMRISTRPSANETPPPVLTPPNKAMQPPPAPVIVDCASSTISTPAARDLYAEVLHGPWRAAAIYAFAGACFALTLTVATLIAEHIVDKGFWTNTLRFLFLFWIYIWPLVLTVNLVASSTWRAKLATASVYFLGFAILTAIATAKSPLPVWRTLVAWLLFNLLPMLLLLAILNRKVRAVGPLVLVFLILVLAGPLVLILIALSDKRFLHLVEEVGLHVGFGVIPILLGLVYLGFVLAGLIGWLTLRWIGSRYQRKKSSDQSIALDAIWLSFAFLYSLTMTSEGAVWLLSGLAAFLAYRVVAWIGFLLIAHKADPTRRNARLLLLRVFSLGKRSERLFEALATHWRHGGSIQLIAGADLATDNLEPHEFLDFLSGKLAGRFINGQQAMDRRFSEVDFAPDQDGRFRVNEFFCREDSWKMVLTRLCNESDAVLMDLRGFSPENGGCIFEINELINVWGLGRVQFIVDETTNEPFLLQCMQESWNHMRPTSPNRLDASTQIRLFRFEKRRGELRQLLHAISVATTAP